MADTEYTRERLRALMAQAAAAPGTAVEIPSDLVAAISGEIAAQCRQEIIAIRKRECLLSRDWIAALPSASLGEQREPALADAARVLAEFAKTAPGRLPSRVQEAIAVVAASPASKSAGGGGASGDTRKPWEKTSWTCARARVDHEGMHCPPDKCADCPNRTAGQLGTSPDQQKGGA
jgi:hypothetical protein